MVLADATVIDEFRSHVAAELDRRQEELVDAVSSALFARIASYQRLARPRTVEGFRADIRHNVGLLARAIAERRPLGPLDLDRFRRIGAKRARQGLPLDAVSDGLSLGLATCWGVVRDALLSADDPRVATAVAADLAMETYPAFKQATEALAAGHESQQGRGTHNRDRSRAELVGRLLAGVWSDEGDARRTVEALGGETHASWVLVLVTAVDGRAAVGFDGIKAEITATVPDALVGPSRALPSPHVPILLPAAADGGDRPASDALAPVAKAVEAERMLLVVADRASTWAALPVLYRRESEAIACARAAACSAGIIQAADSHLYRLLRELPMGARVEYVRRVLGPVLGLSPTKATEALATLEAYFRGRGRLDETAADLRMHRNSFRYRLERAQTLLGVDFRRGPDRARVDIALALRRLDREEALLLDVGSLPEPVEGGTPQCP